MVTPVRFTREVSFQNHLRPEALPKIDMLFTVRASFGAVVLKVRMGPIYESGIMTGMGTYEAHSISSHFKRKLEDWWLEDDGCDVLEQDRCFGHTGYRVAADAWGAFMRSDEEGWKFLEDVYNEWRQRDR